MLIRFLSIFVAFTLFIGSSGLLIQAHFCQNQLRSVSIFIKPESCHENSSSQCNAKTKKCCSIKKTPVKDNCCHDIHDFVKLDLDQHTFKYFLIDKKFDYTGFLNFDNQKNKLSFLPKKIKFFNYKPPLIEADSHKLFQVFLC